MNRTTYLSLGLMLLLAACSTKQEHAVQPLVVETETVSSSVLSVGSSSLV